MGKQGISIQHKTSVLIQRTFARLFMPCTYLAVSAWLKYGRRYRIERLREVREEFKKITEDDRAPWILCSNHLTLIDSLILIWALGSLRRYTARPHLLFWNLPEKMNFYHNPASRLLCYLGKCIPVIRGGGAESASETRDKIRYVLRLGESIMIFPEGTRGRTGKIDVENPAYAVGDILRASPETRVLCVYLRGKNQKTYGDFPIRGEHFSLQMEKIKPMTSASGLRAQKELSLQIIHQLKKMEDRYFGHAHLDRQ